MKNFLLFQPLIIFIVGVALLCVRVSPWAGIALLVIGIASAVTAAYWLRHRALLRLSKKITQLNIDATDIVPIKSGMLGINLLVFTKDELCQVSSSDIKWSVKYYDIKSIAVDMFAMSYSLTLNNGTVRKFSIHPLKNRKEILSTLGDPQAAVGAVSAVGAPAFAAVSAMSLSAGSARQRVEALNSKLAAILGVNKPIEVSYDGVYKMSDIALGIVAGIELVGLVIVGVILLFPTVN